MWSIGVEAEEETSAPHPKKNPGSAPVYDEMLIKCIERKRFFFTDRKFTK